MADDRRRDSQTRLGMTNGKRCRSRRERRPICDRGEHSAWPGLVDGHVSSPNRFGPAVPLKNPHSISTHSQPMIGTRLIRNHQPDLSRSCQRLI